MKLKLMFLCLMLLSTTCFALSPELKLEKKMYKYKVMCPCGFNYGYKYTEHYCSENMVSHSICDLCYIESILKAGRKVNPKTLAFIRKGMREAIEKQNRELLDNLVVDGNTSLIEIHERGFVRYVVIHNQRNMFGEYEVWHFKEDYNELMSEKLGRQVDVMSMINNAV